MYSSLYAICWMKRNLLFSGKYLNKRTRIQVIVVLSRQSEEGAMHSSEILNSTIQSRTRRYPKRNQVSSAGSNNTSNDSQHTMVCLLSILN